MRALLLATTMLVGVLAGPSGPVTAAEPVPANAWQDKTLSADRRAELLVQAMTEDEKLAVVTGFFGTQP